MNRISKYIVDLLNTFYNLHEHGMVAQFIKWGACNLVPRAQALQCVNLFGRLD